MHTEAEPSTILIPLRLSMLSAPAPNATIWSSPPAIIMFLRKLIIWFWSAKLLWNETAVASENRARALNGPTAVSGADRERACRLARVIIVLR